RQLPIKVYTSEDGLPHDGITKIRADSRGLIWFCTPGGLSRFDGYQFVNYSPAQGLPGTAANNLVVTRAGTYWVANSGGLARFQPQPRMARFCAHPASPKLYRPGAMLRDRAGSLWIGTRGGLFRLRDPDSAKPGALEAIAEFDGLQITDLTEGPDG